MVDKCRGIPCTLLLLIFALIFNILSSKSTIYKNEVYYSHTQNAGWTVVNAGFTICFPFTIKKAVKDEEALVNKKKNVQKMCTISTTLFVPNESITQ